MGLHGIPMGNMSNQQLMQMQLHGMDLQRVGMGLPGLLLHCVCDVLHALLLLLHTFDPSMLLHPAAARS